MLSCKKQRAVLSRLILSSALMCISSALAASPSDWQITVAPYLWAVNMNGRVQVGPRIAHVDQTFDDILKHMDMGAMLWVDANKGPFGLFANAMYVVLKDQTRREPFFITAKNNFGIFSAGASYEVYRFCFATSCSTDFTSSVGISPYVGVRYTLNDTTVTVNSPGLSLTGSENQNWADPIIGARLNYTITEAWSAILAADVGGTNTNTHYSYNTVALLGYGTQHHLAKTTFYLGYRLLDQHYATGSGSNYYNWDMKLFGPVIGIAFTF